MQLADLHDTHAHETDGCICYHAFAVQAQSAVVRQAMKSPQASVRQCATRVFKLLGGETLPDASAAPSQAAAPPQPDLMGDLLGEEESAPAAATDLGEDASEASCAALCDLNLMGSVFADCVIRLIKIICGCTVLLVVL